MARIQPFAGNRSDMLKCRVEATGIWWTDAAGGSIEFQAIFGFDLINDKAIETLQPLKIPVCLAVSQGIEWERQNHVA